MKSSTSSGERNNGASSLLTLCFPTVASQSQPSLPLQRHKAQQSVRGMVRLEV